MELLCSSLEAFDPLPFIPRISPEEKKKPIVQLDLALFSFLGAELKNYDVCAFVCDSWDKVEALTPPALTPLHPALAVLLSSMAQMHCLSVSQGS